MCYISNIVSGLDSNDHTTSYQMGESNASRPAYCGLTQKYAARQAIQGLTQSVACEYGNADIRVSNRESEGNCDAELQSYTTGEYDYGRGM
jgi:hypothetical protein